MQFIEHLHKAGYASEIPLDSAKTLFQLKMGICDRMSLKAYFGTQPGRSIRKMQRRSQYASGTVSFRTLELAQDIPLRRGYFELLELAHYEKRGRTTFMIIEKASSVLPQLFPQHNEGCCESISNLSLSSLAGKVVEGWEGNPSERKAFGHSEGVPDGIPILPKQTTTTHRVREINLSWESEQLLNTSLAPELLTILSAKPLGCEPDKAKTNLRECGQ